MELRHLRPWLSCWLWLVVISAGCGGAVENDSPSLVGTASSGGFQATDVTPNTTAGGASSHASNTGMGGTSRPSTTTSTGGAPSPPSNTGGQSGCNYNGQWYPAGSEWIDGDGCGCTGNYPDAGILVMRHCTSNYCESDGFVSTGDVGTYCPVESDAAAEVCATEECIYSVSAEKPDAS